ncbi:hypothetical protein KIKIMORA_01060 [Brevundimonas phage vB_BpoS-Kikimora]|uniref:Uncharacterized protein n=1 Tax=Brevundimonas phage vB_BpoS-Kikimora TaxID=2948601 RepID=A0A9E7SMR3_9CAUD|nr:hypothetical protein KIKIMORA_01060 [Brevundimonas phage vB_BpoS-Kikimora]
MGRQLRRVPMDFDWPLNERWKGFINTLPYGESCSECWDDQENASLGYSAFGRKHRREWYGHLGGIDLVKAGKTPFAPDHPAVRQAAERNVANAPHYYGRGEDAIQREQRRLCALFNQSGSHFLDQDDVMALVKAERLLDFTHTWSRETRYVEKSPPYIPSAEEVNAWSLSGMGHDSINMSVVLRDRARRAGVDYACPHCEGSGVIWRSQEAKDAYENWLPEEPPEGPGYQMWETVSEGSPISPVFATPEPLAQWLALNPHGASKGTTYDDWMRLIVGPGWAPSAFGVAGDVKFGVQAVP